MRLSNARTQQLELFNGNDIPEYAILSHTWGEDKDEALFEDAVPIKASATKKGWKKIDAACTQTVRDKFKYIWVDTCCIDKSSSSELSEAINSMFQYYRNAMISPRGRERVNSGLLRENLATLRPLLSSARWFQRRWTLQELVASKEIKFYSSIWTYIGSKTALYFLISSIAGIDQDVLSNPNFLATVSIAKRFSWAANRKTTRPEDIAYCLKGMKAPCGLA
jgi:hypothetical protein